MTRDARSYLNDILESIGLIEKYTERINLDAFANDVRLQDAVFRRLEIIGEQPKTPPKT